jgi:hypothetical protein
MGRIKPYLGLYFYYSAMLSHDLLLLYILVVEDKRDWLLDKGAVYGENKSSNMLQ